MLQGHIVLHRCHNIFMVTVTPAHDLVTAELNETRWACADNNIMYLLCTAF